MNETCNASCRWLKVDSSKLPYGVGFVCEVANNQVIREVTGKESLVGKWWRSEVAPAAVSDQPCLEPSKKEVVDPTSLPMGGVDPFAGMGLDD